ncbi:uncharacterized protein LOC121869050 [Homarus americanus]|uniref:uncharacterized protein LOC121869050 n=1 Tax=Homarus americanus TaxID=6706 RepID=UPI001C472761|nr:uncharacterized protein LOC121869050 [Homarus americanus]
MLSSHVLVVCVMVTFSHDTQGSALPPPGIPSTNTENGQVNDTIETASVNPLSMPNNVYIKSVRNSLNCENSSNTLARELCLDMQRNANFQVPEQLPHEEARVLKQLIESSSYPLYLNHGNAVHILGQYHRPAPIPAPTHLHYHSGSQEFNPNPSVGFQQSPSHQLPPSSNSLPSTSQAHMHDKEPTIRINSKLMTIEELALLTRKKEPESQILLKDQNSQNQHNPQNHPNYQRLPNTQSHPRHQPQGIVSQNTQKLGDQHPPRVNPSGKFSTTKPPADDTSHRQPSVIVTDTGASSKLPPGNTINVHMLDNLSLPHQERKADMADILTNLQFLTVLMNQEELQQTPPQKHIHNALVMSQNNGSSFRKPPAEVTTEYLTQYQVPQDDGNQMKFQEWRSSLPPGIPAMPHHQAGMHQIQARNTELDHMNYFTDNNPLGDSSSLPTSGISSDNLHDNHKIVNSQSKVDHNHHSPEPTIPHSISPSATPVSLTTEGTPNHAFFSPVPGNDSPNIQTTIPVYQDQANALLEKNNQLNHNKLVNQFEHQMMLPGPNTPPLQDPGTLLLGQQGSQTTIDQIHALSVYLEFLKTKYHYENQPNVPPPMQQSDPVNNISNEDLILASLLQSQMLQQWPPAKKLTVNDENDDIPYIPAIHSNTFMQSDEPQPPASPPASPLNIRSGSTPAEPEETKGLEHCVKSKACSIFLACLVAAGTTSAIAIPVLAPLLGFLGRRRRRDVRYLVLTPQHAKEFIDKYTPSLNSRTVAGPSSDLEYIYNSLMIPDSKSSRAMTDNIYTYITKNKEYLLKTAEKKVESLSHMPIARDLLEELTDGNTGKLLSLLKKFLIKHQDEQAMPSPDEHGELSIPMTVPERTVNGKQNNVKRCILNYQTKKIINMRTITDTKDELDTQDSTRPVTDSLYPGIISEDCVSEHSGLSVSSETSDEIQQKQVAAVTNDGHQKYAAPKTHQSDEISLLKEQNMPVHPISSGEDLPHSPLTPILAGDLSGHHRIIGQNVRYNNPPEGSAHDFSSHLSVPNSSRVAKNLRKSFPINKLEPSSPTEFSHNFEQSNANNQFSLPPTHQSDNQGVLVGPPSPHISNVYKQPAQNVFLQSPGLPQQAQPPSTDKVSISPKLLEFYNSVCRTLTEPDIPLTVIINFIAQRCILLVYTGLM